MNCQEVEKLHMEILEVWNKESQIISAIKEMTKLTEYLLQVLSARYTSYDIRNAKQGICNVEDILSKLKNVFSDEELWNSLRERKLQRLKKKVEEHKLRNVILQTADVVNQNNRVYPSEVLRKSLIGE